MAVPKKKTSKMKRDQRRASSYPVITPKIIVIDDQGEPKLSHRVNLKNYIANNPITLFEQKDNSEDNSATENEA
jgi:large subunit ribosomal protein L32